MPKKGRRTRQPRGQTRAVILKQGFEMYLNGELVQGDERLSVVLDALGYTTGAGYQIWADQAAFRDDLNVYISENISRFGFGQFLEDIADNEPQDVPFSQYVLWWAEQFAQRFLGREEWYLLLRYLALDEGRPEPITDRSVQDYSDLDWGINSWIETRLEANGLALDGIDSVGLARAIVALAEGYALRERTMPGHYGGRHPFAVIVAGMFSQYVVPVGDAG